jgi:hypothetical protein
MKDGVRIMKTCQILLKGRRMAAMREAARRWAVALAVFAGMSIFAPGVAPADDWGCQVILCLSNPGGPEQYSECVPSIEKLWRALRRGDPFPTCDFGEGAQEDQPEGASGGGH